MRLTLSIPSFAHELAAAGATDAQLGLLAFVRKPEQLDAFFAELRERWASFAQRADDEQSP